MCTITQHYFPRWTMNLESSDSIGVPGRFDRSDGSIYSGCAAGAALPPEQLPKGYTPRSVDVCCGRGKKNWKHQGNSSFRKLIHSNVTSYMEAASKHDKTRLVKTIVQMVRSNGGRFLKQSNDGYWYDIGDSQAREKVGHSLRDQVTAISKQRKEAAGAATGASSKPGRRASDSSSVYSGVTQQHQHAPRPLQLPSSHPSPFAQRLPISDSAAFDSPLHEVGELPSDLAGILARVHFPSIQSSGGVPGHLESSSSSFAPSASYSSGLHASSSQSLHASSQSLPPHTFNSSISSGIINFFEPLDEAMEPTPLFDEDGRNTETDKNTAPRPPHHGSSSSGIPHRDGFR